jgi:DNA-binding NtrC family response regulator
MRQASPKVLFVGNGPDGSDVLEILGRFAAVTQAQEMPVLLPGGEEEKYDAIFCGWKFAKGTWRDVLEQTKKLDPQAAVIVLSHCGCEEQWIEALQAGAFDFLVPPYTGYQILAVLEHAIASRRGAGDRVAA